MLTKQLFPLITQKSWQSLLIADDKLRLMNVRYKTEEDFIKHYEKKSIFRTKKEVLIPDIARLAHPERKPTLLTMSVANTSRKVIMQFTNPSDLEEVTSYLQQQRKFTAETKSVGKFRAIVPALFGLAFTALFTFVVYDDALQLEQGREVETGGRNGLFKMLFAWLAEQLGPQNTLITGGAIGLICLYFMFKALQNPPNEVVYE